MGIDKRVILSDLLDQIRNDSFHILGLDLQEALSDVEELLFDLKILRHFQVMVIFVNHDQKLLHDGRWRWQPDKVQNSAQTLIYLFRESSIVLDDAEVGVAYPSVDQTFVQGYSFRNVLVSCLVVQAGVELLSAIGSSHHMNDSFVSSISQVDCAPASFVKDCLPNVLVTVS